MKTLLLLAVCAGAFAGDLYVCTRNHDHVYANKIRQLWEKPVFSVQPGDLLNVLAVSEHKYNVQNSDGARGWIEKSVCVRAKHGSRFSFAPAEVIGYLDAFGGSIILLSTPQEDIQISLDRSFRDALAENIDRETVCRIMQE
jgi:hypothetical protein